MLSVQIQIGGPIELRDKLVAIVCEMLYQAALAEYALYPDLPSPTVAGVPYATTTCTRDVCVDMPGLSPTAALGHGGWDCKSIAAARRAYLKIRHGIETEFVITRRKNDAGHWEYHIALEGYYQGRLVHEDMSAFLGMNQ